MEVRVLGPLQLVDGTGPIELGAPKIRRLLAALVSRAGQTVPVDTLIDVIWEGRPPRSAGKTLQGYLVHLRQTLADSTGVGSGPAIVTLPHAYRLDANDEAVDATRFSMLAEKARHCVADREWAPARVFLSEALSLWRGTAYEEFANSDFFTAERVRLDELKLVAREQQFEVDLALGEDVALLPDLQKAVEENPTRERLWELLIRAHYRAGRQSDALDTYARARDVLATELGIDPGPGLRQVHAAVLMQDPSLDSPGSVGSRDDAWSQPSAGSYAFEGREADLAWLRAQWRAALEDGGRVAVLSGPSGIGKTRLLAVFANELQRAGAVVVRRTEMRAPNPASVVSAAGGRPVLITLDDPLTGLDPRSLAGEAVLVVFALDRNRAPAHVVASVADAQWRELEPLARAACLRIARRWVGDDIHGLDLTALIEESGGNVARLHDSLSTAVAERAERRLDDSVGALRSARGELAQARARVTGEVRRLRRSRSLDVPMAVAGGSIARAPCPYRGLAAYQAKDAALFHGRDAVVEALVARSAETSLVAVVGASGSGKSSVIRAGLLVALADGCLPGSASWPQVVLTPADPLPATLPTESVIVVDQFEQTWFLFENEWRRARYLEAILTLADAGHHVVLSMRADHVERCAEHARFRNAVADGTVLLGAMTTAELTEVITGPAEVAGFAVEDGLVRLILDDVRGLPTPLPLLSTALADAWEACPGATLNMAAYLATGGVSGSLARRAEAVLSAMSAEELRTVRRLLVRLAAGEAGKLVRRRCPYPELAIDDAARHAVDALASARLITVDAGGVEVTHEALFENWPRLVNWLEEDEQGRRLRAHLAPAALEWLDDGRPEADLYVGVRLHAAAEWADEHPADCTDTERAFIEASQERAERELRAERARTAREARGRRRLRTMLGVTGLAALLAIAATVVAVGQRNTATTQARHAIAGQLGAAALVNQPLDHSLLLAASAVRLDDNVSTRSDLLAALQRAQAAKSVWRGDGYPLYGMVLLNDDRLAVAAKLDGATAWDLAGSRRATWMSPPKYATPLLSRRPGTDEVAVADTGRYAFPMTLWNIRHQWPSGPILTGAPAASGSATVTTMAWSPNGRWLAAAQGPTPGQTSRCPDCADVLVWDADHPGRAPRHIPVPGSNPNAIALPDSVDLNPRGTQAPVRVACAGADAFAIVERSGEAVLERADHAGTYRRFFVGRDVTAVASDAAGTTLVVGHGDGTVAQFATATGRQKQVLARHAGSVNAIVFSPDGRLLASMGDDDAINLTNLSDGRFLGRLVGHTGPVTGGAFTEDDRTLYTTSTDGTMIGWDVADTNNLGPQLAAPGSQPQSQSMVGLAVNRSGQLITEYADGTVRLWNNDRPAGPPTRVSRTALTGGAFSPDSRTFVATDSAGGVHFLDINAAGRPGYGGGVGITVRRSLYFPAGAYAAAFSPDGRKIIVVGDYEALFLDARSHRPIGGPLQLLVYEREVAWSPNSRAVAIGTRWDGPIGGGAVAVFDAQTGTRIWGSAAAFGLAWSPDGSAIAFGGDGSSGTQVRRASDGGPISGGWHDHVIPSSLAFTPDGRILAEAGFDGRVVLRDVATGTQIGPPLVTSFNQTAYVTFDPSGTLIVGTRDGGLWRWDISVRGMLREACLIAGRNLSYREWADLHTGRPYAKACP